MIVRLVGIRGETFAFGQLQLTLGSAFRTRKRLERAMKPIVKTLLRRSLMTLSAIVVWAKALARGSADGQTRSMPESDQKTAGGRQQKPNGEG
jgi:hypothetical protein